MFLSNVDPNSFIYSFIKYWCSIYVVPNLGINPGVLAENAANARFVSRGIQWVQKERWITNVRSLRKESTRVLRELTQGSHKHKATFCRAHTQEQCNHLSLQSSYLQNKHSCVSMHSSDSMVVDGLVLPDEIWNTERSFLKELLD